ncbi:hypothetical protein [Ferrimonas balearica]|uniref:hypothetical protein n=1 Tax=Ferrimonas balearica TaxID=44012 RepID=UPI001C99BB5B|nr:hypothetical protein [Ferrimonas balearica]MBY5991119.1 hypothetical protein [Ferrimonas balearica]
MKPGIHYHCPACDQRVEMNAQSFAELMKSQQWPCQGCGAKLAVAEGERGALTQRMGEYRQQATKHLLPIGALLSTVLLHLNGYIGNALLALGFALSFVGLLWVRKIQFEPLSLAPEAVEPKAPESQ